MNTIEFDDRANWLHWRDGGIGSSDAAAIMGLSRWKTRAELLQEKVQGFKGEDQANEYIKQRGNKIEPLVREEMNKKYDKVFRVANIIHPAFHFIRCSLDGMTIDHKTIIEIKLLSSVTPGKVNKEAAGYMKWMAAKEKGEVPPEYKYQILHQLLVTNAEECLFVGYKEVRQREPDMENSLAIVSMKRKDYKEDIKRLAEMEFQFWYDVQEAKREIEIQQRIRETIRELKYEGELG